MLPLGTCDGQGPGGVASGRTDGNFRNFIINGQAKGDGKPRIKCEFEVLGIRVNLP
jgi:hypothetical protein